jgi:hypothetical protein
VSGVHRVLWVRLENKARRVHREFRAHKESEDHEDPQDLKANKAHKAHRDLQATRDQEVHRDRQDHRVLLASQKSKKRSLRNYWRYLLLKTSSPRKNK